MNTNRWQIIRPMANDEWEVQLIETSLEPDILGYKYYCDAEGIRSHKFIEIIPVIEDPDMAPLYKRLEELMAQ